ncbi:hypothetical protein MaudMau93_006080 [Microsporum audouinii]
MTSKTVADTTSAPFPTTSVSSPLKSGGGNVPGVGVGTGNLPISYLYSSSWYNFPATTTAANSHSTHTSVPSSTSKPTTSGIAATGDGISTVSTTDVPDATTPNYSTTSSSGSIQVTSQPMNGSLSSTTSSTPGTSTLTSNTELPQPTTVVNITTKTVYISPTSTATITTSYTPVPTTTSVAYPNWNSTLPSLSAITESITESVTISSSSSSSSFTPLITNSPPATTVTQSATQPSTVTTSSFGSNPLPSFTSKPDTQSSTMTYPSFSNGLPSFTTILPETSTSQAISSTLVPAPPPTEVPTIPPSGSLVVIPVTDAAPAPTGIELIPIGP